MIIKLLKNYGCEIEKTNIMLQNGIIALRLNSKERDVILNPKSKQPLVFVANDLAEEHIARAIDLVEKGCVHLAVEEGLVYSFVSLDIYMDYYNLTKEQILDGLHE